MTATKDCTTLAIELTCKKHSLEVVKKALEDNKADWHNATKDLQERLERISKPYSERRDDIQKEVWKVEKEVEQLDKDFNTAKWQDVVRFPERAEDINAWFKYSTLGQIIGKHTGYLYVSNNGQEIKESGNVIRIDDCDKKVYLYVDAKRNVKEWLVVRPSRHAGDETISWSSLNGWQYTTQKPLNTWKARIIKVV
jgi:hypothetical protein